MRASALLLVAVSLGVSACGSASEDGPLAEQPRADDQAAERTAPIYASVIRQLVTKDHTFGAGPSPFERVFVLDGLVEGAGNPHVPREAQEPFTADVKRRIAEALADLPPLVFVAEPKSVIVDEKECGHVKDGGVLISLGPISKAAGGTVTVGNGLFFACLGGQWLTYVLEPKDEGWRVVGTKGPIAIS